MLSLIKTEQKNPSTSKLDLIKSRYDSMLNIHGKPLLNISYWLMFGICTFCCVWPLQKMDKNKDGVVTLEEFIVACQEVCVCVCVSVCVCVCVCVLVCVCVCVFLHIRASFMWAYCVCVCVCFFVHICASFMWELCV